MIRLSLLFLTLLFLAVRPSSAAELRDAAAVAEAKAKAEATNLLDEVWDFELTASPSLATDVGDPRGQNCLAQMSLQAISDRNERRRAFLSRLDDLDFDLLPENRKLDCQLLQLSLRRRLADFRFQTHLMPINNRSGFHLSFPELANAMNPTSVDDFQNYIARLRDFSRYTDDHIELLRKGIDAGLTQPSIIMRDSVDQTMSHVVSDPKQSLLLKNISPEAIEALGKDAWDPICEDIQLAINESVVPAYRRFADFLKDEYLPACRDSIGASATAGGRAFYRDRIAYFTTLDLTANELHETGIRENKRIRKEMESIRESIGFDGDFDAFLTHLRTDPKFYAKTPEELMQKVALILKTADGQLPSMFGRLPRIPYGLREVPAYVAPQTTSAYYEPPATDGTRAGFYNVNTYNLSSRPLYQLESLSLHEAVPGHHLQLALQAEMTQFHPITRQNNFTAFIEGWALYCERLGKEMGFYKDPYQDFGRLSMEAWRASRLVVDTGIHSMGWSRQQAIDYMKANTALSEHNVVAEIDRYIGWPGQALAYKTGELAITKLRRQAEHDLGEDFDLRAFHDRVLEAGSIPLNLLENRIQEWVTDRLASANQDS